MFGLILVMLIVITAIIAPWIVPYPEDAIGAVHMDLKLMPPSWDHWFGTDEVGNDVFTRVIMGTRITPVSYTHLRAHETDS